MSPRPRPEHVVKRFTAHVPIKQRQSIGVLAKNVTIGASEQMADTMNDTAPPQTAGTAIVSPTVNSSQNPTTKFADDSVGYEATLAHLSESDPFSSLVTAPSSQTIVDYLQRPSIITSGSFTASDAGILWIGDVTSLITTPKQPRMQNIYTWRSDFEVTLQVNADRFQQGRYILAWLPSGGALGPGITGNTLQWRNMHTCNLTKITQLPHVELDLATQTHATLKIPYTSVNPMNTWSTSGAVPGYGLGPIFIMPYSPLNPGTGGSTTCGYTLMGSLTNVRIGGASVGQAGEDAGTAEASAQKQGPITSVLKKVSMTSSLFNDVPLIGPYARQVTWLTKVMAKAASAWGYSKPLALAAPLRMDRKTTTFNAVSDVIHFAKPLGMSAENAVTFPTSVPVNVDEMDLSFITSHYAYLASYTWNNSDAAGTIVASVNVTPQGSVSWSKGQVHTPLSFVSNQFARWRGGIRYRFKLVKTAFHRGRLAIAYYPSIAGTAGNLATSELVFREIVDVNLTSEFEVCCPYMIATPWRTQNQAMGVLHVYVLDALVSPTTVAQSVTLLMEVSADTDMQFGLPTAWQVEPYCPSTAQSGEENYTQTPCFVLGPKSQSPNDPLTAQTVGESTKSVRQMLKRNWHIGYSQNVVGGNAYIQAFPYALSPVTQAATTGGALSRDKFYSDAITLWSFAYAIQYGAVRYIFRPPDGTSPAGTQQKFVVETQAQAGGSTLTQWYASATGYAPVGWNTYSVMDIEGAVEIQSPNWNGGIGRATPAHIINTQAGTGMSEPAANCSNIVLGDSLAVANYGFGVARAAAEDFGMAVFVGVPPVVGYTTT